MPDIYTKKPVDIEAIEFKGWENAREIMDWGDGIYFVPEGYEHPLRYPNEHDGSNGHVLDNAPSFLVIKTREGKMRADLHDRIIKGVKGEFYPCKPDIFEQTYDKKEG